MHDVAKKGLVREFAATENAEVIVVCISNRSFYIIL